MTRYELFKSYDIESMAELFIDYYNESGRESWVAPDDKKFKSFDKALSHTVEWLQKEIKK